MSHQLEELLTAHSQLFVKQKKEWTEIVLDWETTNKYEILDHAQNPVGFIGERGGGIWIVIRRWILRSHRPLEIDVMSRTGQVLLHLSRKFFWLFSDLAVKTPEGEPLGSIHRRFGIIHKKYDLRDENGQLFATIASPFWRLWTFAISDFSGQERAVITKRWGGALREVFSDADTYLIDFRDHSWTPAQRAVIFAAAISIDFDFFENNQGKGGGILNILPD